jgi:hypothetical protein
MNTLRLLQLFVLGIALVSSGCASVRHPVEDSRPWTGRLEPDQQLSPEQEQAMGSFTYILSLIGWASH